MDAPDDNRDVKLYRASADLLPDILRRLNELLTTASDIEKSSDQQPWVPDSQIQKLISLVSNVLRWSKVFC